MYCVNYVSRKNGTKRDGTNYELITVLCTDIETKQNRMFRFYGDQNVVSDIDNDMYKLSDVIIANGQFFEWYPDEGGKYGVIYMKGGEN